MERVHTDEGLAGGVHGVHVVVVPRHIAALVGGDGGLDVRGSEAGDDEIEYVRDCGLSTTRLHVTRVLLGAHLEVLEQVTQCHCVGEVHANAGSGGASGGTVDRHMSLAAMPTASE